MMAFKEIRLLSIYIVNLPHVIGLFILQIIFASQIT